VKRQKQKWGKRKGKKYGLMWRLEREGRGVRGIDRGWVLFLVRQDGWFNTLEEVGSDIQCWWYSLGRLLLRPRKRLRGRRWKLGISSGRHSANAIQSSKVESKNHSILGKFVPKSAGYSQLSAALLSTNMPTFVCIW
jgi:hypothetical protein